MGSKNTLFTLGKLIAVVAAALVFGCAPPPRQSSIADPANALKALSAASAAANAGYNCPTDYNVTLKDNITEDGFDYSGNESFTVCSSTSTAGVLKISGSTDWDAICVYPMTFGYNAGANNYNGTPTLIDAPQCFGIGSGAVKTQPFNLNGYTLNYVAIVDANHSQAMNACLSGPSPCPPHSEGFIQ
jgi:hypothetical protein